MQAIVCCVHTHQQGSQWLLGPCANLAATPSCRIWAQSILLSKYLLMIQLQPLKSEPYCLQELKQLLLRSYNLLNKMYTCADIINRAHLGTEVMHERNAQPHVLWLKSAVSLSGPLTTPQKPLDVGILQPLCQSRMHNCFFAHCSKAAWHSAAAVPVTHASQTAAVCCSVAAVLLCSCAIGCCSGSQEATATARGQTAVDKCLLQGLSHPLPLILCVLPASLPLSSCRLSCRHAPLAAHCPMLVLAAAPCCDRCAV
jgi:hypothetical protein